MSAGDRAILRRKYEVLRQVVATLIRDAGGRVELDRFALARGKAAAKRLVVEPDGKGGVVLHVPGSPPPEETPAT